MMSWGDLGLIPRCRHLLLVLKRAGIISGIVFGSDLLVMDRSCPGERRRLGASYRPVRLLVVFIGTIGRHAVRADLHAQFEQRLLLQCLQPIKLVKVFACHKLKL